MSNKRVGIFDFKKEVAIRTERRFTRQHVADSLGIDRAKLYRLEKDLRGTNDLDMMNHIAGFYDCYLDDLVKDEYHLQ